MGDSSSTPDSTEEEADSPRLSTEGGDREHDDTERSHLHALFVDVTGVEKCIDRQRETEMSRHVDPDTTSVSSAATAVADDDGLTDTIDELQSADEMR
jgi:hypothetical protein